MTERFVVEGKGSVNREGGGEGGAGRERERERGRGGGGGDRQTDRGGRKYLREMFVEELNE